jgi:hydroxyacylglutathione hydrolase
MPIVVDRYALGPLQTNCYIVDGSIVIDPGATPPVDHCTAILVTHGHFDHVAGVADLAERTGAPVYMPAGERDRLERYADFAPAGTEGRSYTPDHLVEGGETIEIDGIAFDVVSIPGHSAGHVAYHADEALFSGDLLFAGGVGRVDLPGGDWDTLLASVRALADRYPPETRVHPGHGPETTLGDELARNPFLAELRA